MIKVGARQNCKTARLLRRLSTGNDGLEILIYPCTPITLCMILPDFVGFLTPLPKAFSCRIPSCTCPSGGNRGGRYSVCHLLLFTQLVPRLRWSGTGFGVCEWGGDQSHGGPDYPLRVSPPVGGLLPDDLIDTPVSVSSAACRNASVLASKPSTVSLA
jgi:hypothetical protein